MRTPSTGRGLHPKVTASTLHLWPLDDSVIGATSQDIVVGGGDLTFPGGASNPTLVEGNIGKALSFNGLNFVDGPTGDDPFLRSSFSFDGWVYTRRTPGTTYGSFVSYIPAVPSELEADNDLFELGYDFFGRVTWRWETGLGLDISGFTDATLPQEQWSHVAFVKADVGGGNADVSIYINGDFVETFAGEINSTGGSNSAWNLGLSSSGSHFGGLLSSARVTSGLLTADEIREAFRRGMAWQPADFDTRLKVVVEQRPAGLGSIEVDLRDFRGRDGVISVEISDTIDSANAIASL